MPEKCYFPFLRLPLLVQLLILQHFRLDELINFSFLRAETKNIVKKLKHRIEKFKLFLNNEESVITFHFDNNIVNFCLEKQKSEESWEFPLGPHVIHHKPQRDNYLLSYMLSTNEFGLENTPEEKVQSAIEDLSNHLLEIFECDKFNLFCLEKQDIKNLFVWKHTKKLENVIIDMRKVDVDEIAFLMNNLTIGTFTTMYSEYWGKELYSGPVGVTNFHSALLDWMTFDSFRNMECKEVFHSSSKTISSSTLPTILEHWKDETGWKTMEYARLRIPTDDGRKLKQILGDLETFSWNRSGLPKEWKTSRNHVRKIENGRGIRRNDGRLATVCLEGQGFQHFFVFVVWREGLECEVESSEWTDSDYSEDEEDDENAEYDEPYLFPRFSNL